MNTQNELIQYLLRLGDSALVRASACASGAAARRPWKKNWR